MSKELTKIEKNITEKVLNQVKILESENNLQFPPNYSYANALKSAYLKLQNTEDRSHKKALEVCTQISIANSLLDMVVQGLSPAKNQCYFIVYGKELTLSRSYFGSVAVTKRVTDMVSITAEVIRETDTFKWHIEPGTGRKILDEHSQSFNNLNDKIVGVYAIKIFKDYTDMEIMTREDIQKAWNQGAMKGNSPAHKNFEAEMCKKTVINRACKKEINTSSDNDIVVDAVNRTTEAEYEIIDERPELQEPQEIQPEASPEPPITEAEESKKISDAQRKRMFAVFQESGKTEEAFKKIIEAHGYKSRADIFEVDYDSVIGMLEDKE